jgi:hypothetical protein
MSSIKFQFTGGMADNHEMNFYEAGRFQYGAARFIYTLERFRQDGKVVNRLSSRVNADIRIKAPQQGSFVQEIIFFAAPVIAEASIQCSFEALFAYVWNLILPTNKASDIAVALAKQEVEREKQRTLQEVERTEQTRLMAEVANNSNATTQQALEILNYAVTNGITIANEDYRLSREDVLAIRDEAVSNLDREKIIKENQVHLNSISPETERKLASQLRKSVNDLALPLRGSARNLNITQSNTENRNIATLNAESARAISEEIESDLTISIRTSIKSYDVETGYGKLRFGEQQKPVTFRVPTASKDILRSKILSAMDQEDVLVSAYEVKDTYGTVIRLILDNILKNEVLDDLGLTT